MQRRAGTWRDPNRGGKMDQIVAPARINGMRAGLVAVGSKGQHVSAVRILHENRVFFVVGTVDWQRQLHRRRPSLAAVGADRHEQVAAQVPQDDPTITIVAAEADIAGSLSRAVTP